MSKVRRYEVTAAGDFASVLSVLTDHLGLRLLQAEDVERTWLETPEGALAAAGSTLEFRAPAGDGAPSLTWFAEDRVLAHDACVAAAIPVDTSELPVSPAFERLVELTGSTGLVSGSSVHSRLAVLASLDDEEKTTARVFLDQTELVDGIALPMVLEVVPLRGYESESKVLLKSLTRNVALASTELSMKDRVEAGVAAAGTSSLSPELSPKLSAAGAWRVVLQQLTESMTRSFSGALSGVDAEDLHSFRVAVRRIRTMLQDGVDIIDPESRDRFRHEYRWLGDVTTPTRDADVHLIEFPELVAGLPDARREELSSFSDLLVRHCSACHSAMVTELRSQRRAEFGAAWVAFLGDDDAWTGCGELADEPVLPVVLLRIQRAHRQLVKSGRRINKKSPPIALHELRKEGKRLRYLLECFGPLLDEDALSEILRPLKDLQDVLGEFQDTEVQANALLELAQSLGASEDQASNRAIAGVIEQLGVRGADARSTFARAFGAFEKRSVQRAFDRLGKRSSSDGTSPRKKKR